MLALGSLVVAGTWYAASAYLTDGALDLFPFTAPAAVIGLSVGWLSRLPSRKTFTWRTGLTSALTGVAILPPWICVAFVLLGMTTAGSLILFVVGAWVAIASGLVLALVTYVRNRPHAGLSRRLRQRALNLRWRVAAKRRGTSA